MVEQERIPFLDHARLRPVTAICRFAVTAVIAFGVRLVHRRRLQGFGGGGGEENAPSAMFFIPHNCFSVVLLTCKYRFRFRSLPTAV